MTALGTDRFGNALAPGLPYARGEVIRSTEDDLTKLEHAWRIMERRLGRGDPVFNFTGLERSFEAEEGSSLDDEISPARYGARLYAATLEHLGGAPGDHDVMVFNRQTAAIIASIMCLAQENDTVIGVSPTYSHPCVARGVAQARARFVDVTGAQGFHRALKESGSVKLVVLTRLAVSYEILEEDALRDVIESAHAHGARVLLDDAGGARVGPAMFNQSKSLALGADIATTGLDKYGTKGPRLGLMAGDKALVARIRAFAFGFGLEARPMLYPAVVRSLEDYEPERVRRLVATAKDVARALHRRIGDRVSQTPVIAFLRGEDTLELCMERSGVRQPPIVPIEATAALAMELLRSYGVHTVHLAAIPPGTSALLIKFIPPETLDQFGGAEALAKAIDASITQVAGLLGNREALAEAIMGTRDACHAD